MSFVSDSESEIEFYSFVVVNEEPTSTHLEEDFPSNEERESMNSAVLSSEEDFFSALSNNFYASSAVRALPING